MKKTKPGAASRRAARIKERRVFPANGASMTAAQYAKTYYQKNFPAFPEMHLQFTTAGAQ